jgi:hypothetical protein
LSDKPGWVDDGGWDIIEEVGVMVSPAQQVGMETHPDIVAMRMPYERAAESRSTQIIEGLTLLAGVYLAISPWVVGFTDLSTITVNNLVTGIAVALLALGFASAFGRTHGLAWVVPLIGIWTVVAPWVVSGEDVNVAEVVVSNVITGALILLLGLATVALGMRRGAGTANR